jgi:hypothetical protein
VREILSLPVVILGGIELDIDIVTVIQRKIAFTYERIQQESDQESMEQLPTLNSRTD